MQKMFNEADLLVLEDRSNSRVRSFKIFDDKRVFPEIYENEEFLPLDKEEKHDVSGDCWNSGSGSVGDIEVVTVVLWFPLLIMRYRSATTIPSPSMWLRHASSCLKT